MQVHLPEKKISLTQTRFHLLSYIVLTTVSSLFEIIWLLKGFQIKNKMHLLCSNHLNVSTINISKKLLGAGVSKCVICSQSTSNKSDLFTLTGETIDKVLRIVGFKSEQSLLNSKRFNSCNSCGTLFSEVVENFIKLSELQQNFTTLRGKVGKLILLDTLEKSFEEFNEWNNTNNGFVHGQLLSYPLDKDTPIHTHGMKSNDDFKLKVMTYM